NKGEPDRTGKGGKMRAGARSGRAATFGNEREPGRWFPAAERREMGARGEASATPGKGEEKGPSPGGATEPRSVRSPPGLGSLAALARGFAALHPWLHSVAPPGLQGGAGLTSPAASAARPPAGGSRRAPARSASAPSP